MPGPEAADPNSPHFQLTLGLRALAAADAELALEHFENATALDPRFAPAHVEIAKLHESRGDWECARDAYERAIAASPRIAELHNALGSLYLTHARPIKAQQAFERALELNPRFAAAKNNLGRALRDRRLGDAAIASFREAIALDPSKLHPRLNIGLTLVDLGRYDEAIAELEALDDAVPGNPEVLCALGHAHYDVSRIADAAGYFRAALAVDAACAGAHFGLANIDLLEGELTKGWAGYEWRKKLAGFAPHYDSAEPAWDGAPLRGRTLVVKSEQGLGDILMFTRFLPRLAALGGRVVFRCRDGLERLMHESLAPLGVTVARAGESVVADCSTYLLSLPHLLQLGADDLARGVPYLRAPAALAADWRARMSGGAQRRVGIAWRGNPLRIQSGRIPEIDDYRALAGAAGVTFYNLSPGATAEELARFPVSLVDLTAHVSDFADTAALIENLDAVISIDTSVAHLAGALGKTTLLLHAGTPDWRWTLGGREAAWYPTVRRFCRGAGTWSSTVAAAAETL